MSYKPSFRLFAWLLGIMATLFLVAALGVLLMLKDISRTIQNKIDNPTSVIIAKYDSTSEAKIESLAVTRETVHQRIDHLLPDELQSALDSVFNKRQP